jgi:hypothetical protein
MRDPLFELISIYRRVPNVRNANPCMAAMLFPEPEAFEVNVKNAAAWSRTQSSFY